MFLIGKSVKPQCFEVVDILAHWYCTKHKSWMSGELFEDWVHELHQKFATSKKKITLIIDNCTIHPHVENLHWV